jgi:hypothetical protein
MSFFEVQFKSNTGDKGIKKQQYRATDLADALRQHDRCNELMQANDPTYVCKMITCHEVKQ